LLTSYEKKKIHTLYSVSIVSQTSCLYSRFVRRLQAGGRHLSNPKASIIRILSTLSQGPRTLFAGDARGSKSNVRRSFALLTSSLDEWLPPAPLSCCRSGSRKAVWWRLRCCCCNNAGVGGVAMNHRGRSNTSAPRAGSLGRIQLMIDLGVAAVEQ